MSIVRTPKRPEGGWFKIDNAIVNDDRLSWEAKGLAAYLLSKPDNWVINVENLRGSSRNGIGTVKRILRELESCGYLVRRRMRKRTGVFHWVQVFHEAPQPSVNSATVVESTDGPLAENQPMETMGWKPAHLPITENQLLKPIGGKRENPSPKPSRKRDAGGGGGSPSLSQSSRKKVLTPDQERAAEMLNSLGVVAAQALATEHDFRFLLDHATAFQSDLKSNPKLGAGVLVARIRSGENPPSLGMDASWDPFWLRWARDEDRAAVEFYGAGRFVDEGPDLIIGGDPEFEDPTPTPEPEPEPPAPLRPASSDTDPAPLQGGGATVAPPPEPTPAAVSQQPAPQSPAQLAPAALVPVVTQRPSGSGGYVGSLSIGGGGKHRKIASDKSNYARGDHASTQH